MVLVKPFVSITDASTPQPFSVNFQMKYNYSFWPEVNDVLLNTLADYNLKEGKNKFRQDDVCTSFVSGGSVGTVTF